MVRKKKTNTENIVDEVIEVAKKITKDKNSTTKIKDDEIEVTQEDINIVNEELAKNNNSTIGEFGEKEKTKSKKKYYTDCGNSWDVTRIVLKVDNKEYTKTYNSTININKDKLGKLTKYAPDKWAKINGYTEGETDLIFELIPIN